MSHITDLDRTVFAEAYHTVLDNFTDDEQKQLHAIAGQLRTIIEAAKKRQSDVGDYRVVRIG